jgi:hypothetical protein
MQAGMMDRRNAYKILVIKPEGKRPFERPRRRWKDNINMDIKEIMCEVVDWIQVTQNRDQCRAVVNTVMSSWIPHRGGKFLDQPRDYQLLKHSAPYGSLSNLMGRGHWRHRTCNTQEGMCVKYSSVNLVVRGHLGDVDADGRTVLK